MANVSKSDQRRERAAAKRAEIAARESRERKVQLIGGLVVVVVVAAILAIGVFGNRSSEAPQNTGSVPSAVDQSTGAYTLNPDTSASHTMELWEDFQCPACRDFEYSYAETYKKLADRNIVKVILHPASFLDTHFPGSYSAKAISAWGCAVSLGSTQAWEYHKNLYANQNPTEGGGWTTQQLVDIADASSVTSAQKPAFKKCVEGGDYLKWSDVATNFFQQSGIQSTPTIWVDGKAIPDATLSEAFKGGPDGFYKLIKGMVS